MDTDAGEGLGSERYQAKGVEKVEGSGESLLRKESNEKVASLKSRTAWLHLHFGKRVTKLRTDFPKRGGVACNFLQEEKGGGSCAGNP